MPRNRSRRSRSTRRRYLARVGALGSAVVGVAIAAHQTGAFSAVDGNRDSSISVAASNQSIVGIVDHGPVKRNNREAMVEISNNSPGSITTTISLDTCSEGTLYDNEGQSGCSVTFTLASGNSQIVDIQSSVTGTIGYNISVTGTIGLDTSGTVDSQSGNVATAIRILQPTKDQDFTAVLPQGNQGNVFEVKNVDVRDNDGDDDLTQVRYVVREGGSGGTIVGEKEVNLAPTDRYSPNGNPAETIQPVSGYTIQAGQLYTLTVRGSDTDGNFETSTLEDTP